MRLYRRGQTWWVDYYTIAGERRRESTRCTDKRAAEARGREYERRASDPAYRPAPPTSLHDALARLLTDRAQKERAGATIDFYRKKAGHIVRVFGAETPLPEIDAVAVDGYIATRTGEQAGRSTIAKELATLGCALRIAYRRGEFPRHPDEVLPVGYSPEYRPRRRCLRSAEDASKLLAQLAPARAAHVAFIIATGARWSESLRAQAGDVRLTAGTAQIRGTKTELADDGIAVVGWMRALLEFALRHAPAKGFV